MSHLFEDYREIHNVSDKLALLIELVQSVPRRVFLTKGGEVQAIVLGPKDYEDLWMLDFEREMQLCDDADHDARGVPEAHGGTVRLTIRESPSRGWPAFIPY